MGLIQLAEQSTVDALDTRVTAAEADIVALATALGVGYLFFETLAELEASDDPAAGVLARVTLDGANNGIYVFDGADWVDYEYDPMAMLEVQVAANTELLGAIAGVGYPVTVEESFPLPDGPVHMLSTFSGRGSPINIRGPFNRVSFSVYPWDPAFPATEAWVRIRSVDKAGAIVYDSGDWFPITAPQDTETWIDHDLGETIDEPGELWAEYFTNGKIGGRHLSNQNAYYPEADFPLGAYSRVIDAGDPPPMIDSVTPGVIAYFKLSFVDYDNPIAQPTEQFIDTLAEELGTEDLETIRLIADRQYAELESSHNLPLSGSSAIIVASTITGWESQIGPQQNVDRIRTKAPVYDPAHLPTKGRIYLFEDSSASGSPIGDTGEFAIEAVEGDLVDIEADFPVRVLNAGAVPLSALLVTDGRIGRFGMDATELFPNPTFEFPRYATAGNVDSTATFAAPNTTYGYYFETVTFDLDDPIAKPTQAFLDQVAEELAIVGTDVEAEYLPAMPDELYATEDVEANAYLDSVAHDDTGGRLVVEILAAKGRQLAECWRLTPVAADITAGIPITMTLYQRGVAIYEKESTLRITRKTDAVGSFKMLAFGDSLTAAGHFLQRVLDLSALDGNTIIEMVGTQTTVAYPDLLHEGHPGKTIDWLTGHADSPIVYSGVIDFAQYLTDNSVDTPDIMPIEMDVNGVFQSALSGADLTAWAITQFEKLDELIAQARVVNPSLVIPILTIPMPAGQDGWSYNYPTVSREKYVRRVFTYRIAQQEYFGGRTAEGIYVVPTGCCVDTRRGFPVDAAEPAFAHDPDSDTVRQKNGLHQEQPGGFQLGDTLWAFTKYGLD